MPTAISLAAPAAFTAPLFPPLPTIPNTLLWAYLGGSLAQCVNAGSLGAFTNAPNPPTYQPTYIGCHGSQGALATPAVAAGSTLTWMGVARYTGGGTAGAAGPLLAPASAGLTVQLTATALSISANGLAAPTALTIAANGGNVFKFHAFVGVAGGAHTLYNLTDATSQVAVASGTMTAPASQQSGIGGTPGSTGTNDRGSDNAFVCWAQTALAKASIDQVYAHVKAVMATKGITI